MISKNDLGKAYRIIRNIIIAIFGFCAFFCGIDITRMMNGLAANPYSLLGFPLFVVALWGIYKLEQLEKKGKIMILVGATLGGFCIGVDPDHPDDAIPVMLMLGVVSQLYIKAREWKNY